MSDDEIELILLDAGEKMEAAVAHARREFSTVRTGRASSALFERLTVEAPAIGLETTFPLSEAIQERFLEGLDDIGLTMRFATDIDEYETTRKPWMPAQA